MTRIKIDNEKFIKFEEATSLLREGDVLLFRGGGLVSLFIKRAGEGIYSHVGVASSVGINGSKIWECVEFREWKGGRSVNLKQYCNLNPDGIDVYRPVSSMNTIKWDDGRIVEESVSFNARAVTNAMRRMTGLPYGWKRILWLAYRKIPFLRLFFNYNANVTDKDGKLVYPVCSTALSHSFYRAGYDLTHQRSDNAMEPSDIARSPLLFYVFTIKP